MQHIVTNKLLWTKLHDMGQFSFGWVSTFILVFLSVSYVKFLS